MRVNFACKGFFNNRMTLASGVTIVMLAIFFIASSFTNHPDRDLRAKEVNLMIRQIGHRLLLQAGDSTSRVLPVTEIKAGTFQLRFENKLLFNHDSLIAMSQGLLPKTEFPSGYTVTVHECLKASIVYGFQLNNTSLDILACQGRSEPRGCYMIEIVFPDLYGKAAEKKKVKQKKTEIAPPLVEPKSVKADLKPNIIQSESAATPQQSRSYPLIPLVFGGILVLLGVTVLIGRFGKILKPVAVRTKDHQVSKEPVSKLPALGKFLFDAKDQRLLFGSEVVSLTDKECKILELFNKNFGELISRETLMQEVWINEGVITGRSLDMFVSKLRKKLSRDPELRITNVHGKGYRLEIPTIQIS